VKGGEGGRGALGEIRTSLLKHSGIKRFSLQFGPRDKSRGRAEPLGLMCFARTQGQPAVRTTFVMTHSPSRLTTWTDLAFLGNQGSGDGAFAPIWFPSETDAAASASAWYQALERHSASAPDVAAWHALRVLNEQPPGIVTTSDAKWVSSDSCLRRGRASRQQRHNK
jgi:hypothetical protein